jgi:hypothetical protein
MMGGATLHVDDSCLDGGLIGETSWLRGLLFASYDHILLLGLGWPSGGVNQRYDYCVAIEGPVLSTETINHHIDGDSVNGNKSPVTIVRVDSEKSFKEFPLLDPLLDLLLNLQVLFEVDSFLIPLMTFATLVPRSIFGALFGIFLGIIAGSLPALINQEALTFACTPSACFSGLLLGAILVLGVLPELIALLLLRLDVEDKSILRLHLLSGLRGSPAAALGRLPAPGLLGRRETADFERGELDDVVAVLLVGVVLVLGVPVILDLRLLLVDDEGGTLEEARLRVLLIPEADVHLPLVLDHPVLQEVLLAVAVVLLLPQELVLGGRDLRLLRMALDPPLLSRFRLLCIMDDAGGAWTEVSTQTGLLLLLIRVGVVYSTEVTDPGLR